MDGEQIDYLSVFHHLPVPVLLMTPEQVIADANQAFCDLSGRTCGELVGRSVFEAFPDNPEEPGATGAANLGASLSRVAQTCQRDVMAPQRHDVEVQGNPGEYRERYWCPVNAPVLGTGGEVTMFVHVVEEIPDLIRKFVEAEAANA
ncbi:MAG: PAS domain-containing protein [Streptosporangiaceae bacterium]